jgi:tetratricopeptide (TPR) repeat protein
MEDARARERRGEWNEAIDLINQVVQKDHVNRVLQTKAGGSLEALAKRKLPYLAARKIAQTRFQAGDYAGAAAADEQALNLDPFAADAAIEGVDSYLLADRMPEAVAMLKAVRLRGNSDAVQTADRMLQQLAAVSPEAAQEAQAGAPQPPPIAELFGGVQFGVPDWDAGRRHLQTASVDITRWTRDLKMEVPMPVLLAAAITARPPATATAQAAAAPPDQIASAQTTAVSSAIFHVEVVPTTETRNLRLRATVPDEFGYVQFEGPAADTPVVFEGQQLVLPTKLKLPAGKYEIRTVDQGKVVSQQELEVAPLSTQTYKVKRP